MTDTKSDSGIYKTFVERGVAVPFETPKLQGARLRVIGGRPELSVASYYDGQARVMIALAGVPKAFSLTMGDRMVLDRLLGLTAYTPAAVRSMMLDVEKSGAYGVERAEKAEEALGDQQRQSLISSFTLLTNCAKETGIERIPAAGDNGETGDAVNQVVDHLVGKDPNARIELHDALRQWGDILFLLGTPDNVVSLRAIRRDVRDFVVSMQAWASTRPQDEAELANIVISVAEDTLMRAHRVFTSADNHLAAPKRTLMTWGKKHGAQLADFANELDWLLDGWNEAVVMWAEGAALPEGARRDVVREILTLIPMLPDEGVSDAEMANRRALSNLLGQRYVKANTDWRTGKSERELISMRERARTQKAGAA